MSLELIKKYGIWAKKSLGQNFLIDETITDQIADIINIMGSDIVEVGPGYGVLTEKLLEKKPKSLHLVELDKDMISVLEDRFGAVFLQKELSPKPSPREGSFQIHNIDVLQFTPEFEAYSVIANIPYYITSPILRHFLYDIENTPENMVILMQHDVAEKILKSQTPLSPPLSGGKKLKTSVLGLFIAKKCHVSHRVFVPKESFYPQPKVESSVLLFQKHDNFGDVDDKKFLEVIKAGFCEPRKKCIKNLVKNGYDKEKILGFLEENNFSENIRAEEISIEKWTELTTTL